MAASRFFQRIVGACVSRPVVVLGALAVVALAGAILALGLRPSAGTETLVDRDSATYRATERFHQRFGGDAVVVLVRQDLARLLLSEDQGRLGRLEGCIAGNLPPGVAPPGGRGGPCAALARDKPAQVVYGPATFINESATQINKEFVAQQAAQTERERRAVAAARGLARARGFSKREQERLANQARTLVRAEFLRNTLRLALAYGIRRVPRPDDPSFVSRLVFDPGRGATTPKARFAYILPNARSALVQVRLRPELSEAERNRAIELIRGATRLSDFRLEGGGTYTVTGAPVVVSDLTSTISRAIVVMLVLALVVMALTLALVFRSRPRLLPLALALAATAVLFGGMAAVGASLTMASIAVLPILVGLAVDYAIQLQSRFDEEAAGGRVRVAEAVRRAAGAGAPTIATACGATAAGFLVLLLSPVPMVRGFGLLLVIGVALAFACALTAGFAALALAHGGGVRAATGRVSVHARHAGTALSPAARGARDLVAAAIRGAGGALAAGGRGALDLLPGRLGSRARAAGSSRLRAARTGAVEGAGVARVTAAQAWRRLLVEATTRPVRVLGIGVALAALGLVVDTQTRVVSDITRLVPSDLPAMRDLRTLQTTTGVSGEIDVLVSAPDLTDPKVLGWMTTYQKSLLKRFGYRDDGRTVRGCGRATLCPALSLPDLFASTRKRTQEDIRALLDAVPPYFSQAVITRDRKFATLAFGIRLMPLDRQHEVIQEMRRRLNPPPGVRATVVGLPVLAAQANARVSSDWRRALTVLASLLAVAIVLLVAFRRPGRALVPLVPIALAGGWSALVLFLLQVPLNPMSVVLGALVIAISTEFSVLLAERFRQQRAAGHEPHRALALTYDSTGRAVMASGVTAVAGFAVLVFSDIRMLREFGVVAVVDMVVSLLGVMVVLPAVLLLHERGELQELPARALRWTLAQAGRLRDLRLSRPRLRRPRLRRPRLRRPRLRRPRVGVRLSRLRPRRQRAPAGRSAG